jgi:hypothetical protein
MAEKQKIKLTRGDTYNLTFELTDEFNVPISIADKTLTFTVKKSFNEPDDKAVMQVIQKYPNNADTVLGKGSIFLPHTETQKLLFGQSLYFDFQLSYLELGVTYVNTLSKGKLVVDYDITRTVSV